jgi:hypothetical protein
MFAAVATVPPESAPFPIKEVVVVAAVIVGSLYLMAKTEKDRPQPRENPSRKRRRDRR